jgi:hypothetical protein
MFLINLGKLYKQEIVTKEEYKRILRGLFKLSEAAIVEYTERAPDEKTLKRFILNNYLSKT